MADFDRRTLLGGLGLAGGALVASHVHAAPRMLTFSDLKKEAEVACLYHCDFAEGPRFSNMATNIANHYQVYGSDPFALQLAIVAHGAGIKFFLNNFDDTSWKDEQPVSEYFERILGLSKNGLNVYLCNVTFERMKLSHERAREAPFISFVPSGVATVALLQSKGFAYLKSG
jgi:uncharacterized protein